MGKDSNLRLQFDELMKLYLKEETPSKEMYSLIKKTVYGYDEEFSRWYYKPMRKVIGGNTGAENEADLNYFSIFFDKRNGKASIIEYDKPNAWGHQRKYGNNNHWVDRFDYKRIGNINNFGLLFSEVAKNIGNFIGSQEKNESYYSIKFNLFT